MVTTTGICLIDQVHRSSPKIHKSELYLQRRMAEATIPTCFASQLFPSENDIVDWQLFIKMPRFILSICSLKFMRKIYKAISMDIVYKYARNNIITHSI